MLSDNTIWIIDLFLLRTHLVEKFYNFAFQSRLEDKPDKTYCQIWSYENESKIYFNPKKIQSKSQPLYGSSVTPQNIIEP